MTGTVGYINARLINPETGEDYKGNLVTEGDLITAIGPNIDIPAEAEIVDCDGKVLAPGLIDMRVFVGEPGAEHQETFETATMAAAAGGVTTMVVLPTTAPVVDEVSILEMIARRARKINRTRVEVMGAITKGLEGQAMAEIGLMQKAGAVAFTDGDNVIRNSRVLQRALSYAGNLDALLVTHAEDPDLGGPGNVHQGEMSTRLGLPATSVMAEVMGVNRDLCLIEMTGARCHIAQLSSAAALDKIADAKSRGLPVTCGVSAAHLSLNEHDIGEYRTFLKLVPPLRSEDDRKALVEGLANGTIDVVVSNHCPRDQEEKRQPFEEAATGAVGLETLLPILLELVHKEEMDLPTALRAVTCRPAQLLGLEEGRLAVGAPADLIIIDFNKPWIMDASKLHSKSKNTPFEGRRLQGRTVRTIVRGRTVFEFDAS